MVNTKIRLIVFFAAKDGEALYRQQKQDQDLTELLFAKFRLKLNKVGKTTRPFQYDLIKSLRVIQKKWQIQGIISDRQSAWRTMDGRLWNCTGSRDQDHTQENEMQKSKMAVWGGLTDSCVKKRSKKQRRKGKLYPFEFRVPKNSKERKESLLQWSVQRNRGKQ